MSCLPFFEHVQVVGRRAAWSSVKVLPFVHANGREPTEQKPHGRHFVGHGFDQIRHQIVDRTSVDSGGDLNNKILVIVNKIGMFSKRQYQPLTNVYSAHNCLDRVVCAKFYCHSDELFKHILNSIESVNAE